MMKNIDVVESVKNSNLPDEVKVTILANLAGNSNRKSRFNAELRQEILESMPLNQPIRVKEIESQFTVQRLSRQMAYLVAVGAVRKEKIITGNKIMTKAGKEIPEAITIFTRII